MVPIVCGGDDALNGDNRCFYLSDSKRWIQLEPRMTVKREDAASIVINNGKSLWITGGLYSGSTTEILTLTSGRRISASSFSFEAGPDLPRYLRGHCLVKLSSSTAMLIGGRGKDMNGDWSNINATYFLDIPSSSENAIVRGPDLIHPRYHHACGVLDNPGDGNGQVVIVAGGQYRVSKSTEIWAVGSQGWTRGPDLPKGVWQSQGITSPDGKSFLLLGGDDGTDYPLFATAAIYKLDYNSNSGGWQWTKLDQELKVAREGHVAMLVPDSFC